MLTFASLGAGLATGVIGAVLGTGGGVFLVPLLVLAFGLPMHNAVATSIVTVIATSSAVASTNVERGTANMRLGMTLEVATTVGAIAGGLTAAMFAPHALEGIFGLVLLPTAYLMWKGRASERIDAVAAPEQDVSDPSRGSRDAQPHSETPARDPAALGALGAQFHDATEGGLVSYRVERLPAGLGISFLAGNLSGLLGIGGGVFKVPALHLVCNVPMKAAAATSNFMIGVTAVASAVLYYGRGEIKPAITAAAVLGVLAGSAIGSIANRYVGGRAVRRLFAVLLAAVAVQMLYRALRGGQG
jgi:uncharacterized membrane protein YfcA